MWEKRQNKRLDQILLDEEIITEDQLKEILKFQKEQGGKLGSHLLLQGYVNEEDLVNALSQQFSCNGVVLSDIEIPNAVYNLIPKNIAAARKIIPFEYDTNSNTVKIACENPTDKNLKDELEFLLDGKNIDLYLAVELAINAAIARHYLSMDTSDEKNLLLKIPVEAYHSKPDKREYLEITDNKPTYRIPQSKGTILLVSDDETSCPFIKSMLESDYYDVKITDNADTAINMLGDEIYHSVFIKDTVPGDYIDLIDRIRKISPRTQVRYFESASELLIGRSDLLTEARLMINNHKLFTSILSTKDNMSYNHSGIVGSYVEKVCQKLGLPLKEKLPIINAAYVHDLAKFYYNVDESNDYKKTIDMTVKLLESLNYSPVVIQMLRKMYIDLEHKYTKRLPIEVLGGNILTIVDLFCDHISVNEQLTFDKFDIIKKRINELKGKLFLEEVVSVFIDTIEKEILRIHTHGFVVQTIIYGEKEEEAQKINSRLRKEGFNTIITKDTSSFVEVYKRSIPDLIILLPKGNINKISKFIDQLIDENIDLKKIPTFLLTENNLINDLTDLLEKDIEDLIAIDGNLDILIIKLRKIHQQIVDENKKQIEQNTGTGSGTKGRLTDLNLIDILNALGPGQRSVKITITPDDEEKAPLILYLKKGQIFHAVLNGLEGIEAVCEAISWSDGQWYVQPISESDYPKTNTDLSNDEILMEGCRLLDEQNHKTVSSD
jgi:DNA-binding response OmpR family regulator